ncbi:hypothetical protein N7509_014064 [Penicillium cosmopolitanum]|uniref:Major facilitator superfamily (MFS) profile domain-containing protein n=1 Tax=Penicillium cosmopolitanum TaxID=1131564 RepID=A0A9W9S0H5_9EURO|nr:uncharacterized protein N7509_014064 [Penicillium cosmopolitanum]KAJ5369452.1 hypothetical protein N7509_014064 [Penicillium cosmopolitanum]
MGLNGVLSKLTIVKYAHKIKATPGRLYSTGGFFSRRPYMLAPASLSGGTKEFANKEYISAWDQGSSSVVASLPGFQKHFGITSGANAHEISNLVSLVYIGCGVGAGLSFFVNDRIGRLWSLRLYMLIWIAGQMVATFSPNLRALYAARIISGLGIGPLTVTGTNSIVEIAPTEIRGLLATWFSVAMLLSLWVSVLCVYGVYQTIAPSRMQYQVVWFGPSIFIFGCIIASFFISESPRWLFLTDKREKAIQTLTDLRGLPADHPRIATELRDIEESIARERNEDNGTPGIRGIIRETFCVPSNLRRLIQAIMSFALAQLSGANSISSYFVPILTLIGANNSTTHSLLLSGMYSIAKFFFTLIASFFFVDAIGRRRSAFLGITIQIITDLYIAIFIKFRQQGPVSVGASQGAIAAVFFHGFGYAVGLLILPYLFSGELWPNRIRSFGSAFSQMFHWLFFYGVNAGLPSLLSSTDQWGAFLLFASFNCLALAYVFFMVPEMAGLAVEEMDELFRGPWFNAYKRARKDSVLNGIETTDKAESVQP